MNKMMKKLTKFTNKSIRPWTLDGKHEGAFRVSRVTAVLDQTNEFPHHYREAREQGELAKHRAERPKIQQQFADLKRGLSAVTDSEWDSIPEVGNLTRKKRRREERSFVVPDSVIVGDRTKGEFENALDSRQQEVCHFHINWNPLSKFSF
jgi:hypothetical protein